MSGVFVAARFSVAAFGWDEGSEYRDDACPARKRIVLDNATKNDTIGPLTRTLDASTDENRAAAI